MSLHASRRFLPILLLLFVGSGCSALIYEIVWFQMLQLVIGSSAVSLGVLLGTFMGGMCLGSLALAPLVSARLHPLRVYSVLELLIGLLGLLMLFALPWAGRWYLDVALGGWESTLLRAVVSGMCLLPPTILMGATLPAIARWMETTPRGVAQLGFFYGANIAGAVFGCLLAGFYLLRVYDVWTATYVAVALNGLVGGLGLLVSWRAVYQPIDRPAARPADSPGSSQGGTEPVAGTRVSSPAAWPVYLAIGLSGFAALGAEVIWTRLLSLMLGATVYTFAIILAVFLVGLGLGSSAGSAAATGRMRPRLALGLCQLLLTAAIGWAAYAANCSLPYWPIDVSLPATPWIHFQLDLVRAAWAVLPAAVLWGASFPLALAAAARPGQDYARLAGRVYAANTLGAIAGSLGFSMLVIPWLGTQAGHQLLIVTAGVAAFLVLAPELLRAVLQMAGRSPSPSDSPGVLGTSYLLAAGLVASVGMVGLLAWSVPPAPTGLIGYGRFLPTYSELPDFIFEAEGLNASIAVSEYSDGTRNFHVSGKVVASSEPQDMRLQRMLSHLPALIHPAPKTVLVVGCGAGVTAGTFLVHPGIERVVICEIEPEIPAAAGQFFRRENYAVIEDPRVEVVLDDARHYILTTTEKFDIITSDPIHPWVKGAAALYSREYFELCKQHLNPGGVVTQWVPLYESSEAAVKSQIGTFMQAFDHGTIWSNESAGEGYDIVLLGSVEATRINVASLQQRLESPEYDAVLSSLEENNLGSAIRLLATYAGQAADLGPWLLDAQPNLDSNLRLQYLAGMSANQYASDEIYRSFLAYRKYPEQLFVAAGDEARELKLRFSRSAAP